MNPFGYLSSNSFAVGTLNTGILGSASSTAAMISERIGLMNKSFRGEYPGPRSRFAMQMRVLTSFPRRSLDASASTSDFLVALGLEVSFNISPVLVPLASVFLLASTFLLLSFVFLLGSDFLLGLRLFTGI